MKDFLQTHTAYELIPESGKVQPGLCTRSCLCAHPLPGSSGFAIESRDDFGLAE